MNSLFLNAKTYHCVDNSSYWGKDQQNSIVEKVNYLKSIDKNVTFFDSSTDDFFKTNQTKYDVIFIDADHSYEGVKKDYLNALNFIKPNGYIIFHDINSTSAHGVKQLWEEIRNNSSIEYVNSITCGIGILQII